MATECIHKEVRIITLSRKEVVDMIGLLAADLAGETLSGNASGATAAVNVVEQGAIKYRLVLSTEREIKEDSPWLATAICSRHGGYEFASGCIECLNEAITTP